VRCIDCENANYADLLDGFNPQCRYHGLHCDPYCERICRQFTPAAEGCGSVDQALRTELARKTKEGC
jgi:hypothetical protein